MKIALIGATGTIGQRILNEALGRGHQVTAIVRDPAKVTRQDANLTVITGDIFAVQSLTAAVSGHDLVVSAYGSRNNLVILKDAARALVDAVKQSGVPRLIVVGGASSLEVAPGLKLIDTPAFPAALKPIGLANAEALAIYQEAQREGLDLAYFSPAVSITPGVRTGKYRTGTDKLVVDEHGESRISTEDYAVALLDEAEKPQFSGKRFTVAY